MTTRNDRQRANDEGSIYAETRTLKSGETVTRYVAQVRVGGRKRRTIHPSEAKAKRALKAMIREAEDHGTLDHGSMTVRQLLDEWARKALPNRNLSPATIERHRWAVRALCDQRGGAGDPKPTKLATRRLRDLSPDDVEHHLDQLAADGAARATVAKLRTTLGMALAWGERRGYVMRNAARVAELPTEARPATSGRSFDAEQAARFLDASAGTPLHAMWTAALYLGLRPGEVAALTWDDVDLEAGIVHVHRSLKRGERGELFLGEPKTKQSVRSLDAPAVVVEAFKAHRQRQNRARLAAGEMWRNPDDLVFTNSVGHALDPARSRSAFRAVVKAAGLGDGWTPNHLRHTAASLMSDAGVPLEEVADQLGHKDTRMASLHYRHRVKPTVSGGTVMADVLRRADGV